MASRCARIWCVRPVSSRTRSSVSPGSARSTAKWVTAGRGSSVSDEIRVRSWRSRPSGASIVPRSAGGRPSTSARYSRVSSRARQLRLERGVRRLGPGEGEQAGGVAVQPVHDAGPVGVVAAGHPPGERLHERARAVAARRMHDDAGRLVHDEHVLVLPRHGERGRRRLRRGRGRGRRHDDALAAGERVALRAPRPVHGHVPAVDQPLRGRARARVGGEEHVEALARRAGRDRQLSHAARRARPR